jgi:hypothetical protein
VGKATKEIDTITESPQKSFQRSRNWESNIDVRKDTEYSAEHVEEAAFSQYQ